MVSAIHGPLLLLLLVLVLCDFVTQRAFPYFHALGSNAVLLPVCAGVRGRLIDLIDPTQKKFEVAVVAALGRHMQSIVVDTGDACKECIRYLSEHQKPRMTFLALDKLITTEPSDAVKAQMGMCVLFASAAASSRAICCAGERA
jgi:hypothetical protein